MTAMESTKERFAGPKSIAWAAEIALKSPEPAEAKAQAYFRRLRLPAFSRQSPGNCARRSAWRGSTAIRASRHAIFLPLLRPVQGLRHGRSEGGEGAAR
jgi:hypothetical protein